MSESLLTLIIPHQRDFSKELSNSLKVAQFAVKNKGKYLSTKDVSQFGVKAAISNQLLRKYRTKSIKAVRNIVMPVPGQHVKFDRVTGELHITCLNLTLQLHKDTKHFNNIVKVNQVEITKDNAHIQITVLDAPQFDNKER